MVMFLNYIGMSILHRDTCITSEHSITRVLIAQVMNIIRVDILVYVLPSKAINVVV